ncbi:class I lanthipeptide [Maribacter sp. 2307UL18-2]|uniref:class I lanthipeptide n=1 Tax=Maribacter sp. 2307UL18-2 TaxID=3386274 RepID=UPI0039BC43F4
MKKRSLTGKLTLNKKSVSNLNMGEVYGGTGGCYSWDCSGASLQRQCNGTSTQDEGSQCKCK